MDSNNCGKACLIGCAVLLVLGIIVGAGCLWCGKTMFSGLLGSYGNASKVQEHFEDLQDEGWEVDFSDAYDPEEFGSDIETGEAMTWRARESRDDDWEAYTWILAPANPDAWAELNEDEPEISEFQDFANLFDFLLLPITDVAMEVHEELELPLPDDFDMDEWVDFWDDINPDRDRGRSDRDQDRDDRDSGRDDREDDEDDTGRDRPESRQK